MKRFAIVAVFMFAIMCMLSACGGPAKEMTDAEAMTKLESYIADGDVDIVSYLSDKGFSLGARGDLSYVFRNKTQTIVVEETGAPAFNIYVGNGNGTTRQFGYPQSDRIEREDGSVDYLTYRATINGRTTKYPVAVLAEIVRLAER